jgi:Tfp pilus assembly PilM family ATPase
VAPLKQRLAALPWGAPWRQTDEGPAQVELGIPLSPDRWSLERLPRRPQWEKKRALFGAALGLGLQGLERAACNLNFSDSPSQSVLSRLVGAKKPPSCVWAVDLGESSVKALQLRNGENGRIEVTDWLHAEHQADEVGLDVEQRNQAIAASLAPLSEKIAGDANCKVICSLPGRQFIVRHRRMPVANDKKSLLAIENAAKEMIPLDLDQLVWRSYQFPRIDELPGAETNIIAARRDQLTRHLAHFERAGIKVHQSQCDVLALYNLAASETMASPPNSEDRTSVILDFGHEGTQLILAGPDYLMHRHIRIGGKSISEAIEKTFQTTLTTCRKIKRNPLMVKSLSRLYGVIEPCWDVLLTEVEKSLEIAQREFGKRGLGKAFALGGGFLQHGALRAVSQWKTHRQ